MYVCMYLYIYIYRERERERERERKRERKRGAVVGRETCWHYSQPTPEWGKCCFGTAGNIVSEITGFTSAVHSLIFLFLYSTRAEAFFFCSWLRDTLESICTCMCATWKHACIFRWARARTHTNTRTHATWCRSHTDTNTVAHKQPDLEHGCCYKKVRAHINMQAITQPDREGHARWLAFRGHYLCVCWCVVCVRASARKEW